MPIFDPNALIVGGLESGLALLYVPSYLGWP